MRMQSAGIDLSAVIATASRYLDIEEKELPRPTRRVEIARARALIGYVTTQVLSISGSEVARRFNVDRSAISRATLRVSPDPELPAAIKTIQKELELETNQHRNNVPVLSSLNFVAFSRPFLMNSLKACC
jgi:chromosomal replication initiation ATPase DnaA